MMVRIVVTLALITFAAATGLSAGSDISSIVADWGDGLELDTRVIEQIKRYSLEKDDLGDYPQLIATDVRRLVFADAATALKNLSGIPPDGVPQIDVSYLEPGFAAASGGAPDGEHQRDFERGFIRIEVLVFIDADSLPPERALGVYTGPEFRKAVSSRIARIWSENNLSCIEVKGVTAILSPTLACNRIDTLVQPGVASEHSQVVSNPGGDDYQTVYFKESLKTFVTVPGGLALHYINYTRAVKLGRIKRSLGRGKIVESEEEKIRELQRRLSCGDTK